MILVSRLSNLFRGSRLCVFIPVSCSAGYSDSIVHLEIRCVTPLVCHSCGRVLWIVKFFELQVYTVGIIFPNFVKNTIGVLIRASPYWHIVLTSIDIILTTLMHLNLWILTIFQLICFSFIIHKSFSVSPCIIYLLD